MDRILQYLRMKTEDKDQETTKVRDNIPAGPLKARAVVEAIHSESSNGDETKATGRNIGIAWRAFKSILIGQLHCDNCCLNYPIGQLSDFLFPLDCRQVLSFFILKRNG